jgi:hypothetical protein
MWTKRLFSTDMECVPPSCGTHRPLCEVAPRESAGPLLGTLLGGASNLEVPVQGIYIISHREHARGTGRRLFLGRPGECERFPRTRICGIPRVSTAVIIRNTQDKTRHPSVYDGQRIYLLSRGDLLTGRSVRVCVYHVCVSIVCVSWSGTLAPGTPLSWVGSLLWEGRPLLGVPLRLSCELSVVGGMLWSYELVWAMGYGL